jgi:hypothetical protein
MTQTNKKTNNDKWKCTLWTVALFLIVSHPKVYEVTNNSVGNIIGQQLAANGCPTITGLIVHAIIFGIALRYMMDMK